MLTLTVVTSCSVVDQLFGREQGTDSVSADQPQPAATAQSGQETMNSVVSPINVQQGFAVQSQGFSAQPPQTFPEATLDPNATVGRYQLGPSYVLNGRPIAPQENLSYRESGIAGWYGDGFDGATTANGEQLNSQIRTFAHRTLPFSTIARITNLDNGRSVVARVNDRGPIETDRLIDVTTRIARELDFDMNGRGQVRVEVLEAETRMVATLTGGEILNTPPRDLNLGSASFSNPLANPIQSRGTSTPTTATGVYVKAGSFSSLENARRLESALTPIGPVVTDQTVVNGTAFWRVRLGPYSNDQEARIALGRVVAAGATDALLQGEPSL